MLSRQNFQIIRQYRNKLVIKGMLFSHNFGHLIICNLSFFIAMYLLLVKTGKDFQKIITFQW